MRMGSNKWRMRKTQRRRSRLAAKMRWRRELKTIRESRRRRTRMSR
jgi:hypothetical protein